MVGIDLDVWIGQEHFQSMSALARILARILERYRERPGRSKALPLKLSFDPVKEGLDVRLAVS